MSVLGGGDRVSIAEQLKQSIENHTPDNEKYARADKDIILEETVDAGHDQEMVLEEYGRLIRCGELYEVNGETVGVV